MIVAGIYILAIGGIFVLIEKQKGKEKGEKKKKKRVIKYTLKYLYEG